MANILQRLGNFIAGIPNGKIDADAATAYTNEIAYQPLPDPYELGFKQELLQQKYNWNSAEQAIKEAENRYKSAEEMLKTAGLTDEQVKQYAGEKAQAQSDIMTAKNLQEQSHARADYTRDLAKKMGGFDMSNYGAYNTSLRDATLNLTAEKNNAIRNFMKNDMEPSEYYDRVYSDLLNAGAPMGLAQKEAARRAEKYGIDRQARYNTMMNMYGNNGDGTMSATGMELLGRILQQEPEMANYYNTMLANPQKQYSDMFQAEKEQAARNDAAAMQLLGYQHDFDMLNQRNNFNKDYLTFATNEGIRGHKAKGAFDSKNRMTEAEFKNELQKSLESYKTDENLREATQRIGIDIAAASEQQKEAIRQFFVAAEMAGIKPDDPTFLAAFKEKFGLTPKIRNQKEEEPDNAVMTIFAEAQTDKYADPRARIQFIDEELAKNQENGYKFKAEGVEYLRKYQDALRYIIAHKEGNAAEKNRLGKKVDLEILKNVTSNDSEAYLDAQRIQTRKKIK